MPAASPVEEHLWMAPENAGHHVHPTIIIQVTESGSAPGNGNNGPQVGALEPAIVIQREHWRFQVVQGRIDLLHVVQHMALGNK